MLRSGSGNEPGKGRTTSPGLWRGRNGSDVICPEREGCQSPLEAFALINKRTLPEALVETPTF